MPGGGNDHARGKEESKKADDKSDDEFDEEKIMARIVSMMDEAFNMDDETRKKTSVLPSMPRANPAGPEVAFKILRELYAEMDAENEAEEAAEAARVESQSHPIFDEVLVETEGLKREELDEGQMGWPGYQR
ncbi:hypothetical protein VE03_03674 [Pseudogymnoascus sp. 23342-1-I1]|nr:hypothetical protein VE03_03579 [Pseudogymnoascus sp. 23342-1-I1]OBT66573.1 hypothetical protein VE03_03674 [Pseudogymnoascus sp. 23342-1-I1]